MRDRRSSPQARRPDIITASSARSTLYRDDALAREIPAGLYVAHVQVKGPAARLEHEEHAPIALEQGTYRVRRQRQLEPTDVGIHEEFSTLED